MGLGFGTLESSSAEGRRNVHKHSLLPGRVRSTRAFSPVTARLITIIVMGMILSITAVISTTEINLVEGLKKQKRL